MPGFEQMPAMMPAQEKVPSELQQQVEAGLEQADAAKQSVEALMAELLRQGMTDDKRKLYVAGIKALAEIEKQRSAMQGVGTESLPE